MYTILCIYTHTCTCIHTYTYITLHCIALHCIALHYIALHTYLHTYIHVHIYISITHVNGHHCSICQTSWLQAFATFRDRSQQVGLDWLAWLEPCGANGPPN